MVDIKGSSACRHAGEEVLGLVELTVVAEGAKESGVYLNARNDATVVHVIEEGEGGEKLGAAVEGVEEGTEEVGDLNRSRRGDSNYRRRKIQTGGGGGEGRRRDPNQNRRGVRIGVEGGSKPKEEEEEETEEERSEQEEERELIETGVGEGSESEEKEIKGGGGVNKRKINL